MWNAQQHPFVEANRGFIIYAGKSKSVGDRGKKIGGFHRHRHVRPIAQDLGVEKAVEQLRPFHIPFISIKEGSARLKIDAGAGGEVRAKYVL